MVLGFTGTRHGMTAAQKKAVTELVREVRPVEAHHGVCVGADADFHWIVRRELPGCRIIGHPGPDEAMQNDVVRDDCNELALPLTNFARNRVIVGAVDYMIGTPYKMIRETRGGTWYTISHAEKTDKPLSIIWPDGSAKSRGAILL